MAAIGTLPVLFATGNHAGRPAASAVGKGGLYACSTHSLIYQTDGSSWSTWATLTGTGLSDPMTTRGDIIVRNSSNVTARLGIGSSGKVLQSDGTDISWQTPAGASITVTTATQSTASFTVPNATWTGADVTGVSASLAAGTYTVTGTILYVTNQTNGTIYYRVIDSGLTTPYAEGEGTISPNGFRQSMPVAGSFVLGSTTTVKLQARSDHSNSTTKQNGGLGTGNISTQLVFVKTA